MVFLAVAILPGRGLAEGATRHCADDGIVVSGVAGPEFETLCETAHAAIEFLESIGLERGPEIRINIVDRMPAGTAEFIGCYDWGKQAVYLLNRQACNEAWGPKEYFRVPNSAEVYRSFLVHEVAHAVAAANFMTDRPTTASQEYIAAVTQMSVMAADQRAAILARYSGDGYDNAREINLLVYLMDPARFIVECYRHYVKPGNGPEMIHRLLRGDLVLQDDVTY
jgi:hypothetical protein